MSYPVCFLPRVLRLLSRGNQGRENLLPLDDEFISRSEENEASPLASPLALFLIIDARRRIIRRSASLASHLLSCA
jgi:hypothetical protein